MGVNPSQAKTVTFMFQQILESYDELFWLVNAIIDSFR